MTSPAMTVDEFLASTRGGAMPAGLPSLLRALWVEARGDWQGAHEIAQDDESRNAAWVHAYLHRKEGDAANAAYWYGRAGRPVAAGSHDEEWRVLVGALLPLA